MKIKYAVIPMLVLLLGGGSIKLCQTVFAANGSDFFLSADMTTFVFAACVVAMLIIAMLVSMSDRKIPVANIVSKSIPSGVFGFLAAVAILGVSALKVVSMVTVGSESLMGDVLSVFISLFGGFVLLYESCILFTGVNKLATLQLLGLCVPLWYCSRLVSLFSEYSKSAIRETEIFDIVAVALMCIFFYHQAVYFAQLPEKRSPVKLFVFGLPMVLCTLVATADMILKDALNNSWTMSDIVQYAGDIAVSIYAIFLMYSSLKKSDTDSSESIAEPYDTSDTPDVFDTPEQKPEMLRFEVGSRTRIVIQQVSDGSGEPKRDADPQISQSEAIPTPHTEPAPKLKAETGSDSAPEPAANLADRTKLQLVSDANTAPQTAAVPESESAAEPKHGDDTDKKIVQPVAATSPLPQPAPQTTPSQPSEPKFRPASEPEKATVQEETATSQKAEVTVCTDDELDELLKLLGEA